MEKARIYIGGLTDDQAMTLLPVLRQATKKVKGAKVEIDHPDPDPILEKEYQGVERAVMALNEYTDNVGEYDWATKLSEAKADLKRMVAMGKKLSALTQEVVGAVSTFEFALLEMERKQTSS